MEPLKYNDEVLSAQFSPDGKRMVTVSWDHTLRLWDVVSTQSQCPDWLLQLSEAISGQVLSKWGVLEDTKLNRAETIQQIREKLSQELGGDDWVVWGRWFLADPLSRTISPSSRITIENYFKYLSLADSSTRTNFPSSTISIEGCFGNLIRELTTESIAEAESLAFGDRFRLERISQARSELEKRNSAR
jgi:hypothetical protein